MCTGHCTHLLSSGLGSVLIGLGELCLKLPVLGYASNSWIGNVISMLLEELYYAHIMLNIT